MGSLRGPLTKVSLRSPLTKGSWRSPLKPTDKGQRAPQKPFVKGLPRATPPQGPPQQPFLFHNPYTHFRFRFRLLGNIVALVARPRRFQISFAIFSGRKWFTRKFAARRGQISKLLFELSKSRSVDLQTLLTIMGGGDAFVAPDGLLFPPLGACLLLSCDQTLEGARVQWQFFALLGLAKEFLCGH